MDQAVGVIIAVPIYIVLIWNYFNPREGMLFGQRWKYKEEPDFTEEALCYTRFASVIGLFFLTIVLVSTIYNPLYGMFVLIGLFLYIIYSILTIRRKVLDGE